jgi:molybdopterin/thiamine biosynthesis adenylyltransferase
MPVTTATTVASDTALASGAAKPTRKLSGAFDYSTAFSRNIGWVTQAEQQSLAGKRVALAGMGGVGGFHLLTLVRLGIQHFHIADLDSFELANWNRQAGATLGTLGQHKAQVLARMALDINPDAQIRIFPQGVNAQNIDAFFTDVDLYIDGLDFFAFDARQAVFQHCAERRIPATTVAPLGLSAALLNFLPGRMNFEAYFQLAGRSELVKAVHLLVGLAPAMLHLPYLADRTRVDLAAQRGPSTVMACQLCAGIAASEALKILLGRGKVWAAPHGVQFDGYRNKLTRTWRPGGNRNPLNRLAIAIARRQLGIRA